MQLKAQIALEKDNKSILDSHASLIQQNADSILLRVESSEFTGPKIASMINLTDSTIKIQAQHIALEGIITANGNVKIETDGSITVNNGTFKGSIDTALDIKIGQSLNMPVYVPTGYTDRINILNSGSKGTRYGIATNKNAFITVVDNQYILSGTTGIEANEALQMRIYSNQSLEIYSEGEIRLGGYSTTTYKITIGGSTYTISRDANGFLKAT